MMSALCKHCRDVVCSRTERTIDVMMMLMTAIILVMTALTFADDEDADGHDALR